MSGAACDAPIRRRLVQWHLPATLQAVDGICTKARTGILGRIPERERFPVELLLREALTNAVQYGAAGDPAREVACEIELYPDAVALRVSDPGDGFDWRRYLRRPLISAAESGRGIRILRRYASMLRFNEKGNCLEVIRNFDKGEGHGRF